MSQNNLPKNIGKKIAEALKNEKFEALSEVEEVSNDIDLAQISDVNQNDQEDEVQKISEDNDDFLESTSFSVDVDDVDFDKSTLEETNFDDIMKETPKYQSVFSHTIEEDEEESVPELKLSIDLEDDEEDFEMPNNIQVLKRLIAQLPTGVPKQTGAQIIRQTIEALGIPMKSVLQDAQKVRECLSSSIKDCSFTIQEYKTNIKNLERQSANYQKQLTKLNDVIGLFVYNNKK